MIGLSVYAQKKITKVAERNQLPLSAVQYLYSATTVGGE